MTMNGDALPRFFLRAFLGSERNVTTANVPEIRAMAAMAPSQGVKTAPANAPSATSAATAATVREAAGAGPLEAMKRSASLRA